MATTADQTASTFAQSMLNDKRYSPDRQADIQRMVEMDRRRKEEAKYDPAEQSCGDTILLSLHHQNHEAFMERNVIDKFGKMYPNGINESDGGVILKKLVSRGEGYNVSVTENDECKVSFKLRIFELCENEADQFDGLEDNLEEAKNIINLFHDVSPVAEYETEIDTLTFNNLMFYGMDILIDSTQESETCIGLVTGHYKKGISAFLSKHLSIPKDLAESYEKDGNYVLELTSTTKEVRKVFDLHSDYGILKKEVEESSSAGFGWAKKGDEVFLEVALIDDGKEDTPKDPCDCTFKQFYIIFDKDESELDKVYPEHIKEAIKEVRQGETADIVIRGVFPDDPLAGALQNKPDYFKYASKEFRKANNLSESGSITYRVTTTKIIKARTKHDGKIKFKILNEDSAEISNGVKSPRNNQRAALEICLTIGDETLLSGRGEVMVGRGELLPFVEEVVYDMKKGERMKMWTEDASLVHECEEFKIWVEAVSKLVFQGNVGNILDTESTTTELPIRPQPMVVSGKVVSVLKNVPSLSIAKQVQTVRELFDGLWKKSSDVSCSCEVKMIYFESRDTYWQADVLGRREFMINSKEQGNRLFKAGCYGLAKKLYSAGFYVYSQWNFGMISKDEEKVICRPIRFSLMMNLATAEYKLGNEKEAMKLLDEAVSWCDEDLEKVRKRKQGKIPDDELEAMCSAIDEIRCKGLVKRAAMLLPIGVTKLDQAKEDLMYVKKYFPNTPGLRVELVNLKKLIEHGKNKKKKNYSGFLEKAENKDILKSDVARTEQRGKEVPFFRGAQNPKPDFLDLKDVPKEDWVKKTNEFYGIVDHDLD